MHFLILRRFILPLETPNVVAQVEPQQEPAIGQLHQAAIDGGFVEPAGDQRIGYLGMTEWVRGMRQVLQDRDPAACAAQILGTQQFPRGFQR